MFQQWGQKSSFCHVLYFGAAIDSRLVPIQISRKFRHQFMSHSVNGDGRDQETEKPKERLGELKPGG
jgi:hypothetical protein